MLLYLVLLSSLATRLLKTLLLKKLALLLKKLVLLPKKLVLLLKKLVLLLRKKLALPRKKLALLLRKKLLLLNNLDLSTKEFEAVFHKVKDSFLFIPTGKSKS